jgi:hypothetical protein
VDKKWLRKVLTHKKKLLVAIGTVSGNIKASLNIFHNKTAQSALI